MRGWREIEQSYKKVFQIWKRWDEDKRELERYGSLSLQILKDLADYCFSRPANLMCNVLTYACFVLLHCIDQAATFRRERTERERQQKFEALVWRGTEEELQVSKSWKDDMWGNEDDVYRRESKLFMYEKRRLFSIWVHTD